VSVARTHTLIVHPGALGDVLLAVPAIRALRAASAGPIGLLAGSPVGRLLLEYGEVDAVFALDGPALVQLAARGASAPHEIDRWLRRTATVVGWMDDPDGSWRTVFLSAGIPHVMIRSARRAAGPGHQSEIILKMIAPLVSADCAARHPLRVPERARHHGRRLIADTMGPSSRDLVLIHPGSGSHHKCTSPDVMVAVIDWAAASGLQPCLLEGPADADMVAAVRCTRAIPAIRGVDLSALAAVLSLATLYIGHDSGVTHLADWLDVPTIAIYGPTDPTRWGPVGRRSTVIRAAPCRCADWDAVRRCEAKPCLKLDRAALIDVCAALRASLALSPLAQLC
jgi:heptosyltransferase III